MFNVQTIIHLPVFIKFSSSIEQSTTYLVPTTRPYYITLTHTHAHSHALQLNEYRIFNCIKYIGRRYSLFLALFTVDRYGFFSLLLFSLSDVVYGSALYAELLPNQPNASSGSRMRAFIYSSFSFSFFYFILIPFPLLRLQFTRSLAFSLSFSVNFQFSRVVRSAFLFFLFLFDRRQWEPFYTIENLIMCTCTKNRMKKKIK